MTVAQNINVIDPQGIDSSQSLGSLASSALPSAYDPYKRSQS